MDLGFLGKLTFDSDFILRFFGIIFIDLILAGDNAVVIAMAVRSLPRALRIRCIMFGSAAAVVLRVILTFFAAQLLNVQFVKFVGGVLIIWIAVKLFIEGSPSDDEVRKEAKTLRQAIWIIVVADLTMSLDNILAVAGASQGNLFLLIFGLTLSIPFVVFTSNLLSLLMDKYPMIVYIGTAILGKVGGEMIITDPFFVNLLAPSKPMQYGVQVFFTVGVIAVGKLWIMMKTARLKAGKHPRTETESPRKEG